MPPAIRVAIVGILLLLALLLLHVHVVVSAQAAVRQRATLELFQSPATGMRQGLSVSIFGLFGGMFHANGYLTSRRRVSVFVVFAVKRDGFVSQKARVGAKLSVVDEVRRRVYHVLGRFFGLDNGGGKDDENKRKDLHGAA